MTKEQDYQLYQCEPVKKDPNGTRPKLECLICKKKLLSMTVCSTPDEDPRNPTHYYCNCCNKKKYGYPERHRKWNKELCFACKELLPREYNWNDIPGRGGMCNTTCQYMILICNWVRERTPFEAVFNKVLKRLQHYSHDKDKLYNTAQAKVRGGTSAEVADKVASYNMFDPNQYQQPHPKVTESENIRANHLEFAKSLFQYYCQHLGLTHNHISAELAFNFYVNKKITYLLGTSMNIESARETFYNELIQNTSLFTNHNFASIITEINKEIEHHTQQRYPITYTIESSNNPSYHYTPGSAINISSTDASTLNTTSTFRCFPFQSKQRKEDLLEPYCKIVSLWEITESEGKQEVEEEEEYEDQEFTYQNPILENLEIETPNLINQLLPPVIVINQPPVEPIGQPIQPPNQQNQQLLPVSSQQQQQLLPPQQQQMAYTLITKLDKFNGKEDDAQVWLNNMTKAITANNWNDAKVMQAIPYFLQNTTNAWYQSLAVKPQNFNGFKTKFLWYFSNNNSINKLVNTFTMIRQEDTKAVTTYLGCFHRNLCQI
ncbi:hypothetical protein G9A89_021825 [Geosiphon pyriformis]|nr:hypothetical protein G9A89_021825 [Geosiphon pyriformis]